MSEHPAKAIGIDSSREWEGINLFRFVLCQWECAYVWAGYVSIPSGYRQGLWLFTRFTRNHRKGFGGTGIRVVFSLTYNRREKGREREREKTEKDREVDVEKRNSDLNRVTKAARQGKRQALVLAEQRATKGERKEERERGE